MTNDAERVSDIVARLRPSFNTDLPVSHAIDKCREEELRNTAAALSRWLVENNALKAEAITIIEAQSKALAEARGALRPFVEAFDRRREFYASRYQDGSLGHANFDKMPDDWPMEKMDFTMGDFRRAALASSIPENPNG